jgi:hypothetical protein
MFTTNDRKTEKKIRVRFLRDAVADKRDWFKDDVGDIPASEARLLSQTANASGIFCGRGPSVLMLSENI